ncbi:Peptidyl-prolyl cis-trans isomerase pin4 [Coemansia sp. BCRC 34962]|nr:Peptidyl-prolyl cis-trans isomerase pin4 [Coemansia sp. BCRC 34962]
MSKAIEETLRKLERAHIGEPAAALSTSPPVSSTSTSTSTASGVASPAQGNDTLALAPKEPSDSVGAQQISDPAGTDSDAAAKARSRRTVQSMYGAPPGYNASMGVGGVRDTLGNGRVASGRQRNSIMVPDHLQAAMQPQNIVAAAPLQLPMTRLTGAEYALMANMPDDAIPNAIVVKNINFVIKREELLQTMADLGLPLPYAFNYHFDGGVFRGLAFGNFRAPEEAARAIVGLNGISLLGRPLKVEYKKALPGTAPPPHPNTIAMMTSSAGSASGMQSVSDVHTDINYPSSHSNGGYQQQQQQQFDQPIPRQRRNPSGTTGAERPRSMMVFPSAMPAPELNQNQSQGQPSGQMQKQQQQQQQQQHHHPTSDDTGTMIDLDDKDTRLLYDLVSQFRHDKAMAELEFPSTLNTKQRQSVMLIAERFGLNHETKGDAQGRYIRVYKGLETLLESTEVRRRSVASPNPATLAGNGSQQTPRYGSVGRSRPASMLYPDTMSMNGLASPPQRMNPYQQQQQQQQQQQPSHGFAQDPTRVRSYTTNYSQGNANFSSQQFQQQQQMPQPFPRSSDNPGRASGNYVGYPSRLYQDSVVVPSRQPHGPEMTQNFAARQQVQQERQAQRQMQLKVLQQNRQRRLSSTAEDGAPVTASPTASESSPSSAPAFRIEKPGSKAIPIVKPTGDSASSSAGTRDSSPASLALAMGERTA